MNKRGQKCEACKDWSRETSLIAIDGKLRQFCTKCKSRPYFKQIFCPTKKVQNPSGFSRGDHVEFTAVILEAFPKWAGGATIMSEPKLGGRMFMVRIAGNNCTQPIERNWFEKPQAAGCGR